MREAQSKDGLCQRLFRQADKSGEKAIHPYYLDNGILMRYVTDNKQRFEVTVVPPEWGPMLLKLAHDDLGHNGTARTYTEEKLLLERYEGIRGVVRKAVLTV